MIDRVTLCFLIILAGLTPSPLAQERDGSGTITGKVTLDGKPAAGVILTLSKIRLNDRTSMKAMMEGSSSTRAVTDSEGRYQFTKLAEATYSVSPFAPSLTVDQQSRQGGAIALTDGEAVEGIDFELKSGGVITGTVTASDGRPLIGLNVSAMPDGGSGDQSKNTAGFGSARTDDRGVYRIFGLAPGQYRVESRMARSILLLGGSAQGTPGFYHDRTDPSKPGVVNLGAGSEIVGIDIRIAPPSATFEAAGRVVDEGGRAVPDVNVMCKGDAGEGSPVTPFGPQTNAMGEFKLRGLKSGSYTVAPFMLFAAENEYYGEPAKFEVKGANVTGLEIKVHKGMTVSGQVVLEGTEDPVALTRLRGMQVMGATEGGSTEGFNISRASIGPDGDFMLQGLAPGKLHLLFGDLLGQSQFQISRAELNGLPQKEAIPIEPGQNLTGLRIVVLYANCSIHGQVTVTGGKAPKGSGIMVLITRTGTDASGSGDLIEGGRMSGGGTTYADPSGNFKLDGLAPGDYQVTVEAQSVESVEGSRTLSSKPKSISQTVTLASGQDAELNVTIDLAANSPDK